MSYSNYIGLDVASQSFVAALFNQGVASRNYANSNQGIQQFLTDYAPYLGQGLVVLESTGGYEKDIANTLIGRRIKVHRISTERSAMFRRSLNPRVKTDDFDALALARYGAERGDELACMRQESPSLGRLKDINRRIEDLKAMRVQEIQRRQHPHYSQLRGSIDPVLAVLDQQIKLLTEEARGLIEADSVMSKIWQVLKEFPGIGEITAMALIVGIPELGKVSRRQVASLVGVAPHPNDSGLKRGYRATRGGRQQVRRALFMATLSAIRHNEQLKPFYQRLVGSGKKKMVAMVATMRKMIVILNAQIRDEVYS